MNPNEFISLRKTILNQLVVLTILSFLVFSFYLWIDFALHYNGHPVELQSRLVSAIFLGKWLIMIIGVIFAAGPGAIIMYPLYTIETLILVKNILLNILVVLRLIPRKYAKNEGETIGKIWDNLAFKKS